MAYWVGVASRDHVRAAVAGGFCQFNHGKLAPLKRLLPGDLLIYYSPKERMTDGAALQEFTAIGTITAPEPYEADADGAFRPYRRSVRYRKSRDAAIRPLLDALSFTKNRSSWGLALRRGLFEINAGDYAKIHQAMT